VRGSQGAGWPLPRGDDHFRERWGAPGDTNDWLSGQGFVGRWGAAPPVPRGGGRKQGKVCGKPGFGGPPQWVPSLLLKTGLGAGPKPPLRGGLSSPPTAAQTAAFLPYGSRFPRAAQTCGARGATKIFNGGWGTQNCGLKGGETLAGLFRGATAASNRFFRLQPRGGGGPQNT